MFYENRNLCCTNLLNRVKLGYTLNFTFHGHLEVPLNFAVGDVVEQNQESLSL